MPLLSSSLIAHTTAVSPRPPTRSAPPDGAVRVEFTLDDTRHRQDVEVKASSAKPKKVNFMAFNGRVVNNNGLGRVQCNVEINHGNYTYEAVPAFTVRFPVTFDKPEHVTGVKCYKV
ncbi:40S ribosomal protein S26E [Verticillium dahliae VDG2]|nr:40S ribosomal protein S26E [Verticillium dahliae VDG2]